MRISQIHAQYSTSAISGENETVAAIAEVMERLGHTVDRQWRSSSTLATRKSGAAADARRFLSLKSTDVSQTVVAAQQDLVLIHNPTPFLSVGDLRALNASRIPIIQVWHNFRHFCIKGSNRRDGRDCYDCEVKRIGRLSGVRHRCYRTSTAGSGVMTAYELRSESYWKDANVVAISAFVAARASDYMGRPVSWVAHPPVEAVAPSGPSGDLKICFLGRLESDKGARELAEAFVRVDRSIDVPMALHIVGDGPDWDEVERITRGFKVEMHGALPRREAMAVLGSCHIGVVPSQWDEPFGRVAAEMLALGVAPIVTPRGGLPEIVKKANVGLVAAGCSAADIARALHTVIVGGQYGSSVATLAKEAWQVQFSQKAAGAAWTAILEAAVSSRR
jgi:glycosyltransferase involved in cell wall biosynthesis